MPEKRSTTRRAVGLLVKLGHHGVDEFVQKYATNLSSGGMFIRTREPKAIGTELRFKVEIADGQRVLQGTGVVRWVRAAEEAAGSPGMGIEFLSLDSASRALVDRMLRARPAQAAHLPPLTPVEPLKVPPLVPPFDPFAQPPSASELPVEAMTDDEVEPSTELETTTFVVPSVVPPPPPPEVEVFTTVVASGVWTEGEEPSVAAPSAEIELDLADLLATTPEPPVELASAAAEFDIDIDLVPVVVVHGPSPSPGPPARVAPSSGPTPDAKAAAAFPGLKREAPHRSPHEAPPDEAPPHETQTSEAGGDEVIVLAKPKAPKPDVRRSVTPPHGRDAEVPRSEVPRSEVSPLEASLLEAARVTPAVAGPGERVGRELPTRATPSASPARPVPVLRPESSEPPPSPVPPPVGGLVFLKPVDVQGAQGPVIGIDLGTTNSACAVVSKGRPIILSSKDGYNTIPSVVALTPQGKLLVGHRAKAQMILNPTQSIFGAKRLVGRSFDSPTVRQVRDRFHYEICSGEEGRAAVRLGPHVLSLEEVQGLVLRECREMAQQALGQEVTRAVVTCPAYYSEPQREAVRRAGHMAGLKVERILNEPTAAALAFGMNRELTKTVLVYDLGGGTFDATLLRLDKNVFEVLATGGDVFLGGVDFDNQVVDVLLERYATQHGQPFDGDRVALSRVADMAEKCKVALSERARFDVHLPMLELDQGGKPRDLKCTVTRQELEAACDDLVDRTIQVVHDVLLDAKLKPASVDDVILVGGMSRMPLVRERLQKVFKKPAHASVNADEAVALGAALYTGNVDKVSSVVLIDVVPMTVGLGKAGGGFHRLIERNTPLPATKSFGISTHEDNQQELEVTVFQGEDSNVAGNELIGVVRIDGLPRGPKGAVQVAITLSLDAECVLKVEAKEFRTRKAVKATLATRFTAAEIAAKLHITEAKGVEVQQERADELEKRAGGFWGRLKKAFSRR